MKNLDFDFSLVSFCPDLCFCFDFDLGFCCCFYWKFSCGVDHLLYLSPSFIIQLLMSFSKSRRQLSESTNYNPPPGYYNARDKLGASYVDEESSSNFARDARWKQYGAKQQTPGPGEYHPNPDIKKRLLEESKKKEEVSNFKINSIPSIPKHTTAGIYEELAPGILVMHQIEEENVSLGPGSYDPKLIAKKIQTHKFNPQHQKKFIELVPEGPNEVEQQIEKMKEAAREQRRILQAKQLFKKSPAQSLVNPPDVCLELIILRERQLKASQVPAPGYYYNDKTFSGFQADQRPTELQNLAGKADRFEKVEPNPIGPGKYQPQILLKNRQGGFIPKSTRKGLAQDAIAPGPGAYKIQQLQQQPIQPKSRHPAIFGSGCVRFTSTSAKKQISPGPGSYYIERTNRKRRPKTINIRNVESMTQTEMPPISQTKNLMISPQNMEIQTVALERGARNVVAQAQNSSFFSSSLRRFQQQKQSELGPGKYQVANYLTHKTFSKRHDLLGTDSRFGKNKIQPKLGPGYYNIKEDLIRTKKVYDINIK